MRRPCVNVAGVVVCRRLEDAGERIDQGARTQVGLSRILKIGVSIGASHAKMLEVRGFTAKAAVVELIRPERMLDPGLANLLKALVVTRSAAHSIEVVRDDRMIGRWQRKKIHDHVAGIAGSGAHAQADLGPFTSKFF